MTTPTGAADERERLMLYADVVVEFVKTRQTDNISLFHVAQIRDMLRADAETIAATNKLAASMCVKYAAACEQLAAQSAELERVRKDAERYRQMVGDPESARHLLHLLQQGKGDEQAFSRMLDRIRASSLAAPSAAGGEKEG